MENSKTNRAFTTLDALTVVAALFALVLVAVPIVGRQLDVKNVELAKNETNFLSERLANMELEPALSTSDAQRSVASTGSAYTTEAQKYGARLDPWGHSYNIKKVKNTYGQVLGVAVWSNGPNAMNDTDESRLWSRAAAGDVYFDGDDVGSFFARR